MPAKKDLPSTLRKSPKKAQDTFSETLESAEDEYGKGERASRTAFASLKHSFEKQGDHWEPKAKKGPSDDRAATGGRTGGESAGGVDVKGHTKEELVARAKKAGVTGYSSMNKTELGQAIAKKNG